MKTVTITKAQLAKWFEDCVLRDYYHWRLTLPQGSMDGIRYKGMITRLKAVGAAKQLLASVSNGKKGEWGIERLVVRPVFRPLFTDVELKEARRRFRDAR